MSDLPEDPASPADASDQSGGLGGEPTIDETRKLITQRMQGMAKSALDVYEQVMKNPSRNATAQLAAARDVLELLTEGKLQAPVVKQARPLASVTDLAKLSEEVRLRKQADRRGG